MEPGEDTTLVVTCHQWWNAFMHSSATIHLPRDERGTRSSAVPRACRLAPIVRSLLPPASAVDPASPVGPADALRVAAAVGPPPVTFSATAPTATCSQTDPQLPPAVGPTQAAQMAAIKIGQRVGESRPHPGSGAAARAGQPRHPRAREHI